MNLQPWWILRATVLARPGAAARVARYRREAEAALQRPTSVTCTECGRYHGAGERWRLFVIDVGEVAIYCPQCAEREFGDP